MSERSDMGEGGCMSERSDMGEGGCMSERSDMGEGGCMSERSDMGDGDDPREVRDFDRGKRDRPGHCDASRPCRFEALPRQGPIMIVHDAGHEESLLFTATAAGA